MKEWTSLPDFNSSQPLSVCVLQRERCVFVNKLEISRDLRTATCCRPKIFAAAVRGSPSSLCSSKGPEVGSDGTRQTNQPVLDPGASGEGGDLMACLAGWQRGVFKTWLGVVTGVGGLSG